MRRLALLSTLLAAGCTILEPAKETAPVEPAATPTPAPDAGAEAAQPPQAPLATSNARTLEEYKSEVAHAVLHANAPHTYIGKLPEILKSVVVLQVTVDRNGTPVQVRLLRSNGLKDLEQRAIQSVRSTALPKPTGTLTRSSGTVTFTETWLFRNDGKFQIRTLAGPQ